MNGLGYPEAHLWVTRITAFLPTHFSSTFGGLDWERHEKGLWLEPRVDVVNVRPLLLPRAPRFVDGGGQVIVPPPEPQPLAITGVFADLQRELGLIAAPEEVDTTPIGPDRFPPRVDSPLAREHAALNDVSQGWLEATR